MTTPDLLRITLLSRPFHLLVNFLFPIQFFNSHKGMLRPLGPCIYFRTTSGTLCLFLLTYLGMLRLLGPLPLLLDHYRHSVSRFVDSLGHVGANWPTAITSCRFSGTLCHTFLGLPRYVVANWPTTLFPCRFLALCATSFVDGPAWVRRGRPGPLPPVPTSFLADGVCCFSRVPPDKRLIGGGVSCCEVNPSQHWHP